MIAIADGGLLKTVRLDRANIVKTKKASNIRDMDYVWDADRNEIVVVWIDAFTKTIKSAGLSEFLGEPKSRVRRDSTEKDYQLVSHFVAQYL